MAIVVGLAGRAWNGIIGGNKGCVTSTRGGFVERIQYGFEQRRHTCLPRADFKVTIASQSKSERRSKSQTEIKKSP
jgi:hypothetical protein